MNFFEAVRSGYRNYFNFSGRATRPEFWWFTLFQILITFAGLFVLGGMGSSAAEGLALAYLIWFLVTVIPNISVAVRRLHDIGRSGWWLFITLIPFAGLILYVFWATATGPDNRWGPGISAKVADAEAALNAQAESGEIPLPMLPFEMAKLELARTGKRRVFRCSRCGKPVSLGWKQCDHCKATFDQFPPSDTGQTV